MDRSVGKALQGARAIGIQYWMALAIMTASLLAAEWFTPHSMWYDRLGRPDYETLMPHSFGDWVETKDYGAGVINPTQGEALRDIYSQIVTRTYLHKPTGRVVMLSLAYGEVQQGVTQLHRPESCYSSQGFTIRRRSPDILRIGNRSLDIFRMSVSLGGRNEQITYWIRTGDRLIPGPAYILNLTRMQMGLRGMIADGLLFRISEIATDSRDSNVIQDRFIKDLLESLTPSQQTALIGSPLVSEEVHPSIIPAIQ